MEVAVDEQNILIHIFEQPMILQYIYGRYLLESFAIIIDFIDPILYDYSHVEVKNAIDSALPMIFL